MEKMKRGLSGLNGEIRRETSYGMGLLHVYLEYMAVKKKIDKQKMQK